MKRSKILKQLVSLSMAVDDSDDYYCIVDRDGRFVSFNKYGQILDWYNHDTAKRVVVFNLSDEPEKEVALKVRDMFGYRYGPYLVDIESTISYLEGLISLEKLREVGGYVNVEG